jgi:RNA polymerase sigma factor (sigma-70 family)
MMYLSEHLQQGMNVIANSIATAVTAKTENVEPVENANFVMASELEQAKKQLIYQLSHFVGIAGWLVNHQIDEQDEEIEPSKMPADFSVLEQCYTSYIKNPDNLDEVMTALQEFPFDFETLTSSIDILMLSFESIGYDFKASHLDLMLRRLQTAHRRCEYHQKQLIHHLHISQGLLLVELVIAERRWLTARQALASANSRLVLFIATQYKGHFLEFEDLTQEGQTGLLKAVDRFNPHLGFQFSTYAAYWIRKAISRALSRCERVVRVPCGQSATINKLFRLKEEWQARNGKEPNSEQLAQLLELTREEIDNLLLIAQPPVSLENFSEDEEESFSPIDFLEQQTFCHPLSEIAQTHLENLLNAAIQKLTAREADVIGNRFGINGTEMTLQEIGVELNLTRERVRQIQVAALNKMKCQYGEQLINFL